jgi:hypothetical protein
LGHRLLRALILIIVLGTGFSGFAWANWVASGSFRYQDREFDDTGFTGNQPMVPIRYATIEIRDLSVNGGQQLLATGSTDGSGNFSINVVDSSTKTRNIVARVISSSTAVPGLFLSVTNVNGSTVPYAVTSVGFSHNDPNLNLNLGTTNALIGAGGEIFNLYDVGYNSLDYLRFLTGAFPTAGQALAIRWEVFSGFGATSFLGSGVIRVGDPSAYNDTPVAHETGHYAREIYSATDSPGGIHHLTNCEQDLRVAWEEGWATYFGQAVRKHFGLPHPELYVRTTGGSGPGNLDFYFDVEDESPYTCDGAASEVTVYSSLWDVIDSASTPDRTPGMDEIWDNMAGSETAVWDVMRNYIRTATNRTLEDFWDGWFIRNLGSLTTMQEVFSQHAVFYYQTLVEPNDTIATAYTIQNNGIPVHETYFRDVGNGSGSADTDYVKFTGEAGVNYIIETRNLLSDANTSLILYAADGVSQLAANDDRAPGIKSSLIQFTSPTNSTYYVKSVHGSGFGIYGSYDLSVISSVNKTGGSQPPPSVAPQVRTTLYDKGTDH